MAAIRAASLLPLGRIVAPPLRQNVSCRATSSRAGFLRTSFRGAQLVEAVSCRTVIKRSFQSSTIRADIPRKEAGPAESLEYRIFFNDPTGKPISPWHDIPLDAGNGLVNFVCEIPKETKAKMEVASEEANNPIKQDTKKGKLRFYPYNIHWNYGLLPQTWEDPTHANPDVDNCHGDNDPVDLVEIGEKTAIMGEVYPVKPLGVLAMIDEGELDWKVVAIRADDPKAVEVNDVEDVERVFPGTLTAIREWFRDYKIPDGKPANTFGLNNEPANKEYALKVIAETHDFYNKLMKGEKPAGDLALN